MKKMAALLLLLPAINVLADCVEGDCANGYGQMTYEDGSIYSGEWKNGNRHGQGVLTRANGGGVYIGDWQDGMPNGQGLLTHKDNSTQEGLWKNGLLLGSSQD